MADISFLKSVISANSIDLDELFTGIETLAEMHN